MSRAHTSLQSAAIGSSGGYTLVELLVTLGVASVLIGLAAPAFNQLVRQRALSAHINDLAVAVAYARSEAIRRGAVITLEAQAPTIGNEWGGGYCVVESSPLSVVGAACAPADPARLLRVVAPIPDVTLAGTGALSGVTRIGFSGRGLPLQPLAGGITLCSDDNSVDPGRRLDLAATGRAVVGDHACHGS